MRDTIFALSSGNPPAGIAVVRISGPATDAVLQALIGGALPAPRRASLRTLRHGTVVLDRGLVLRFPAPESATGEDMAELHLHGGRATIAAVYTALATQTGVRIAEPGEFTRRAFENGRIDLAEAEGLAWLVRSETEGQRRAALAVASGGLTPVIAKLTSAILDASARVEASLDFDGEDDVIVWPERGPVLRALSQDIDAWLQRPPAERLHNGVRIVVAGPPNAGKSSLINYLALRDAAIVSPIAGTTRDVIEVPIILGGVPVILIDTAGLRDATDDPIEAVGIRRAENELLSADVVLWLGDCSNPPTHPIIIPLQAKADILSARDGILGISVVTGEGLDRLATIVLETVAKLLPSADDLSFNARQRACLASVRDDCVGAAATDDLLIAAEHLRLARGAIDVLTGKVNVEAMLDALFGTFCIGK